MDELKKFTVKNFIKYGTPCFGCDKPNNFYIGYSDIGSVVLVNQNKYTVVLTDEYVEVNLHIQYAATLKIIIYHKNNKVLTNDVGKLNEFLRQRDLFLWTQCHHCGSEIRSSLLQFNCQTNNSLVIAPVTIFYEFFKIIDNKSIYYVNSAFDTKQTIAIINKEGNTLSDLKFDLPLLPKYEMKTKEYIINKLRTYILYS